MAFNIIFFLDDETCFQFPRFYILYFHMRWPWNKTFKCLVLPFHLRGTCYHQITHALLQAHLCSKGFTCRIFHHAFYKMKAYLEPTECRRVKSVHIFFFFLSHSVGSWHCSINFGRSTGMGKWILSGKGLVNILPQKLTASRCWISTLYSRDICKRLIAIFFSFCVSVCFCLFWENIVFAQGWVSHKWIIKKKNI